MHIDAEKLSDIARPQRSAYGGKNLDCEFHARMEIYEIVENAGNKYHGAADNYRNEINQIDIAEPDYRDDENCKKRKENGNPAHSGNIASVNFSRINFVVPAEFLANRNDNRTKDQ